MQPPRNYQLYVGELTSVQIVVGIETDVLSFADKLHELICSCLLDVSRQPQGLSWRCQILHADDCQYE